MSTTCIQALYNLNLNSYGTGIAFNQLSGQNFVYISSYASSSSLIVCDANSPTNFTSCHYISGDGTLSFSEPAGLAFHPVNHLLYIADWDSGIVYACSNDVFECPVNTTNGVTLDTCTTQSGFNETIGLTIGYK